MNILMFYPSRVDDLPPTMTAAASLAEAGATVELIAASSSRAIREYLVGRGVKVNLSHTGEPEKRRVDRARYRADAVGRLVKTLWSGGFDCVWYHQSHFHMWYPYLQFRREGVVVVVQMHELENHVMSRWLLQKAVARRADLVIAPESNRGWIIKVCSGSKAGFCVIPNRSLNDIGASADEGDRTRELFIKNGGSPECDQFVIYLGAFMRRRCLRELILAFRMLDNPRLGLILLGGEPGSAILEDLRRAAGEDRRIVIHRRIPPPGHFDVARGCSAGVILYAPLTLNEVYCAPNKVYEYAEMGLGMILPNLPGMVELNRRYGLGSTCDPLDPGSIASAILTTVSRATEESIVATRRFLADVGKPEDHYRNVLKNLERVAKIIRKN